MTISKCSSLYIVLPFLLLLYSLLLSLISFKSNINSFLSIWKLSLFSLLFLLLYLLNIL